MIRLLLCFPYLGIAHVYIRGDGGRHTTDRSMSLNNLAKIVRVLFEMLGQTEDIVIGTTQSLPHREPQCRVAARILSVNCYNPRDTCIGRSSGCY
jgi:hypothetical protein